MHSITFRKLVLSAATWSLMVVSLSHCSKAARFAGSTTQSKPAVMNVKSITPVATPPKPADIPSPSDLKLQLFIGAEATSDACKTPPVTHATMATRLVPFNYCLSDATPERVASATLCLKANDDSTPDSTDKCFQTQDVFEKLALLKNGKNFLRLFARDEDGKLTSDEGYITLNIGQPPNIDLLQPLTSSFASAQWRAGEKHTVRWKITDDDTAFKDLKIIVSLIDRNENSVPKYLGCSFANAAAWHQCPLASLEKSTLITGDAANNVYQFDYVVPSDYDAPRQYMILVTAIDQSGNAAVSSTPEINASFEVIAGRSYEGAGGSGVTMQRRGEHSYLASDKLGQLYMIDEGLKINAFDYRTCRFFRVDSAHAGSFDCPDVIDTGKFTPRSKWVYAPDRDVFFATATQTGVTGTVIVMIDFNKRSITQVLGGSGNPIASSKISSDTDGSLLSLTANESSFLFYHKSSKLLYFKSGGQIFSLNEQNKVNYVFGSLTQSSMPADQSNVRGSDLQVPIGDFPFVVTGDGRMLIWGTQSPNWALGAGFGMQYLVEGITGDPTSGGYSLRAFYRNTSGNPSGNPVNFARYSYQACYDAENNIIYSPLAWLGIAKLALPAAGSPLSLYTWQFLVSTNGGSNPISKIVDDEKSDQSTIAGSALPRQLAFYSYGLTMGNSGTLIFSDTMYGLVLGMDLNTNRLYRVIGYASGVESDQLAVNRRLDTPRWLYVDKHGDTIFSDFYHVQKVSTSVQTDNYTVSTLEVGLKPQAAFYYNGARDEVLQISSSISLFSGADLTKSIYSAPISYPGYEIGFGVGSNFLQPKMFYWYSSWDGFRVSDSHLKMFELPNRTSAGAFPASGASIKTTDLTAIDGYPLAYPKCGASTTDPCAEPLGVNGVYKLSDFRLPAASGHIFWRSNELDMAMTADDSALVSCIYDASLGKYRGAYIQPVANRITLLDFKDASGTVISCPGYAAKFLQYKGQVYMTDSKNFYQLDLSLAASQQKVTATLLPLIGAPLVGTYGSFYLTDDAVYYSDMASGRVLRNWRGK